MVVGVKVSGVVSFPSYGRCSGAAGLGCEGGREAGGRGSVVRAALLCPSFGEGCMPGGVTCAVFALRSPRGSQPARSWCSGRAQRA